MIKSSRTPRYWQAHKNTLNEELDKLDSQEINFILNHPQTTHARSLYARVDQLVVKELDLISHIPTINKEIA